MNIQWPARLQEYFNENGFQYAAGEGALHTDMQVGLPEARQLVSDVVWTVQASIMIPFHEFPILTAFYETELKNGSLRFYKTDPLDNGIAWYWRFTQPFVASGFGGDTLLVQMNLERIPATANAILPPTVSLPISMALVEGEHVVIHAIATNADSFVWHHADALTPNVWTEIVGETGPDLAIPHAHHADNGDYFRVTATNINGSVLSNILTLHVTKIAPLFDHPFAHPIIWTDGVPIGNYDMSAHFLNGGDVVSYALHNFPPGITIDAQGVLHGTPTGIQDHPDATVEAINSIGSATSNAVDVQVIAVLAPPRFDGHLTDLMAIVGEAFSQDISAHSHLGGAVDSFTLQNAPAGMVIDNAGVITWPIPVASTPIFEVDFSTDPVAAGWGEHACQIAWSAGDTTLRVEGTGGGALAYVPLTTVIGKTYIVSVDLLDLSPSQSAGIVIHDDPTFPQRDRITEDSTTPKRLAKEFTATATTTYIGLSGIKNYAFAIYDDLRIIQVDRLTTITAHNAIGDAVSHAFGVEAVVLGPELVIGGTFDANVDGFVATRSMGVSVWGSAGTLKVLNTQSPGTIVIPVSQTLSKGVRYMASVNIIKFVAATHGPVFMIPVSGVNYMSLGYNREVVIPIRDALNGHVRLDVISATGEDMEFDNFSIREILP